jgi:hydroxymethylpyrimidine pyrophosphatase-like HAD family hydrolase
MPELRRWIAEFLFERELEEDYQMGCRAGHDQAMENAKAQIQAALFVTAKKNQPGLALALEALK